MPKTGAHKNPWVGGKSFKKKASKSEKYQFMLLSQNATETHNP